MKIHVILNRDGGTLKTTNLKWFSDLIKGEFLLHGHDVEIRSVSGSEVIQEIEAAAKRSDLDALIVGGGDGTVSAAAGALMGTGIALGILPAGTMNLFARTLQIPLDLQAAVAALANGQPIEVDIATANGNPFVHQFALGLHARMVRMRERFQYGSRFGKIIATTRAIAIALRRLPAIQLKLDIDGHSRLIKSPAVAISNNLYGEGHIPFADNPRGGCLGVYICETRNVPQIARLTLDIMLGNWRRNPSMTVHTAKSVRIVYGGKTRKKRSVLDGELCEVELETIVEIHARALTVLAPPEATYLAQDEAPA